MGDIYLVRHGESVDNQKNRIPHLDDNLTARGVNQAKKLGEFFRGKAIKTVVSSSLPRVITTAEIIAGKINRNICIDSILDERRLPSVIEGKNHDNDFVTTVLNEIKINSTDINWRYSDEENYIEFQKRVKRAVSFLFRHEKENFIVVTHASVIKVIAGLLWYKRKMSYDKFFILNSIFAINNGGMINFSFLRKGKTIFPDSAFCFKK